MDEWHAAVCLSGKAADSSILQFYVTPGKTQPRHSVPRNALFFSDKTPGLSVISQAIFSDYALKPWGAYHLLPCSSLGLLCNGTISLVVLTLLPRRHSKNWTLAENKQIEPELLMQERAMTLESHPPGSLLLLLGLRPWALLSSWISDLPWIKWKGCQW